jgi:hypothetical protein
MEGSSYTLGEDTLCLTGIVASFLKGLNGTDACCAARMICAWASSPAFLKGLNGTDACCFGECVIEGSSDFTGSVAIAFPEMMH